MVYSDYEAAAALLFNRPTGKLKIPTKGRKDCVARRDRVRRGAEDGIDDCGGGTFPGRWEWDDATLLPPSVWPVRRQIAMFVSG